MLYVLTEQAVFWPGVKVMCCLAKEPGEEVDRSHLPQRNMVFTGASFFCLDQWSLKRKQKNSKDELKIYDVEFKISRGEMAKCGESVSNAKLASLSKVECWFRYQN